MIGESSTDNRSPNGALGWECLVALNRRPTFLAGGRLFAHERSAAVGCPRELRPFAARLDTHQHATIHREADRLRERRAKREARGEVVRTCGAEAADHAAAPVTQRF